jgi:hypothetical protein
MVWAYLPSLFLLFAVFPMKNREILATIRGIGQTICASQSSGFFVVVGKIELKL